MNSFSSHFKAESLKPLFDLHFKLTTEISTSNTDVTVLHLNMTTVGYVTLHPHAEPRGAAPSHLWPPSSSPCVLLPTRLNRIQSCSLCLIYGLSCYFPYSGGSGSFITDPSLISTLICTLHWTPIRKKHSTGGGDELYRSERGLRGKINKKYFYCFSFSPPIPDNNPQPI